VEGAIYPLHDLLQDLAVDLAVFWHHLRDTRQFRLLLVVGDRNTTQAPRLASLTNGCAIDMAAKRQGAINHPLLFRSWPTFVLEGFADGLLYHIL
jgi:hypothetical protein